MSIKPAAAHLTCARPWLRLFLVDGWLQTIKNQFCALQIRCGIAYTELGVDGLQQLQRFFRSTFALPERGKITGCAQLPA